MDNLDRAWKYLSTITEAERHFNDLVFRIRALSSTWLLASFAGIGFVLTKDLDIDVVKPVFTLGIAVLAAFGITLLWMLDLLVYQNLLSANFIEGLRIEKDFPDLPQVRHIMQKNQPKGSVRTRIVWFHIAMMFGALTPGVIICFLWLIKDNIFLAGFLFLVYLAASIGMGRFIYIESVRQVDKFTPILSSEE